MSLARVNEERFVFGGKVLVLGVLVLLLNSCTSRVLDFTMVSTQKVELSKVATYERVPGIYSGKDQKHTVVIFPIGQPNGERAVNRAIAQVDGGVALVDGTIESGSWHIPYLYGQSWYTIKGRVLVDPALRKAVRARKGR